MNEPPQFPKCQAKLIKLEGGLVCCPKCGFDGDEAAEPTASIWTSQTRFWVALLSSPTLALICFLVQRGSVTLGASMLTGVAALAIGLAGSIYCACWLSVRFIKDGFMRIVLGFVFSAALLTVNFSIIAAGCASNPKM